MNQTSNLDKLNSILQYIYVSLIKYPPPDVIILKFKTIGYDSKFWKSISQALNISTPELMMAYNLMFREPYSNANLILSAHDLNKLYSNDIIPDIKIDTSTFI